MPILGSRLREVLAAFFHMTERCVRIRIRGARFESPGALEGVLRSRLIQGAANRLQIGLVRGGERVEIEEFHVIAAGIVIAADEPRIRGNVDASLPQAVANFRPVGHGGKEPRVGAAAASPAGSAIMGRFVRIVEAGRSMAQDHHQTGETAHQASRTQNAGHSFCFFFGSEARQQTRHRALGLLRCFAST